MRTIRVTGKGSIRVKPDMTRLTITLTGVFPEYKDTLKHSSEDTEKLKAVLEPLGFERTALKTLSFDVDTKYESYRDKNNDYKQRFVGYEFTHIMKVEFASDNDLLGRTLYALANAPVKPEFRISYTIKNQEAAKNELLGKAVTDAKEKAAVLTKAAEVTLKDIQSIDYSWGEITFETQPMRRAMLAEECAPMALGSASYDMDIEPDDIDVSDTVTVIWEIG